MKKLYTFLASALVAVSASAFNATPVKFNTPVDFKVVDANEVKAEINKSNFTVSDVAQIKAKKAPAAKAPAINEEVSGYYVTYSYQLTATATAPDISLYHTYVDVYDDNTAMIYGFLDTDLEIPATYDPKKKTLSFESLNFGSYVTDKNGNNTDMMVSAGLMAVKGEDLYYSNDDVVVNLDPENHYMYFECPNDGQYYTAILAVFYFPENMEEDDLPEIDRLVFNSWSAGFNTMASWVQDLENEDTNEIEPTEVDWYVYASANADCSEIYVENLAGAFLVPTEADNHRMVFKTNATEGTATADYSPILGYETSAEAFFVWPLDEKGELDAEPIITMGLYHGYTQDNKRVDFMEAGKDEVFSVASVLGEEYYQMQNLTIIFPFLLWENTGVDNVVVEDTNAPVEYYNLQGVRVENPESGLYIRRQGNVTTKVIL